VHLALKHLFVEALSEEAWARNWYRRGFEKALRRFFFQMMLIFAAAWHEVPSLRNMIPRTGCSLIPFGAIL
jgi:hypothetical protein